MVDRISSPYLVDRQLAELLAGDWQHSGPLRITESFTADELAASALLVNARRLLQLIRKEGGAGCLPNGSFTPAFANLAVRNLWWGESGEYVDWDDREFPPDSGASPLRKTRAALGLIGALIRMDDRLVVTRKGDALLQPKNGGKLYASMLRAYLREMDHPSLDSEPAIPTAWSYTGYSLWVIGQLATDWYPLPDYLARLLPDNVTESENARLRANPAPGVSSTSVQSLYHLRFIMPMTDFGLVEERPGPGYYGEYRQGRLYSRVLRFEFSPVVGISGLVTSGSARDQGSGEPRNYGA